eukprot:gene18691-21270_t
MDFEHASQKHLISAYPPELQKKVILLMHFHNFLVAQHHQSESAEPLQNVHFTLMKKEVENLVTKMKFKQSSTSQENNIESGEEQELPFLKKWVRTKHAVVFRMSNRTVQVVFFDRSEVLVSAEARVITHVSKLGQRTEHTIDNVLASGRADIAKRLKYTKDVISRLISKEKEK